MYVFLDVDGVLNTEADWARKVYSLDSKCEDSFCKLLNSLHEPKVVLSSTWRNEIARDGTTAVHIDDLIKALKQTCGFQSKNVCLRRYRRTRILGR